MSRKFCRICRYRALILLCAGLGWSATAWSQQSTAYGRSTAIDQADSRAEQEAEQMVSLSADKITQILQSEAGLLLQVKKAIVRKAFEQGRVLDPNDLTDDAVFRLIKEDQNVRVIATQEIEDRSYIKAKPTREELARNMPCRDPFAGKDTKVPDQIDAKGIRSQEQLYWAKHDSDLDCYLTQYLPDGTARSMYEYESPLNLTSQPSSQPTPLSPSPLQRPQQPSQPSLPAQPAPSMDFHRQVELAGLRPEDYFGLDSDEPQMALPPDFPSFLTAGQTGSPGSSTGMFGAGAGMSLPSSAMGSGGGGGLLGSLSPQASAGMLGSQQSRFGGQKALDFPSFSYGKLPLQPRLRHRPNPYADVPSLYDLYAQYSRQSLRLSRFGEDIFRNGTGNLDELPMDLPAGPDYVIGPGDGLTINLSGGMAQRLQRVVDREGRVALPEVGAVEIAGKNLGDVQRMVRAILRSQFRDIEADVSLSRIRTVRVYVVGDVERPGAYDVSSLSTPLNALYLAGGPTSGGSLRLLEHYRGKQLIEKVDVYDLLLHGINGTMQRLEAGDTIQVPPLSGLVTVEGMVRRPAMYELNGEKSLAEVLQLAGGVLPTGTLRHVDVERVESHESRTMLRLDIPETNNQAQVTEALEDFKVQDGDKIKITPILPYASKTVYLDGYVSRPGKFAYTDGMKVT
ncbi:MAG: SLBB domain-containing protein, partial [Candidatus Sulfotelmatobacter sp.]